MSWGIWHRLWQEYFCICCPQARFRSKKPNSCWYDFRQWLCLNLPTSANHWYWSCGIKWWPKYIPANAGDDVVPIGWGFTIPDPVGVPSDFPNRPQTVTLEYVPNDQCDIDWKALLCPYAETSANQMCAYGEIELVNASNEKKGTCQGDSGKIYRTNFHCFGILI